MGHLRSRTREVYRLGIGSPCSDFLRLSISTLYRWVGQKLGRSGPTKCVRKSCVGERWTRRHKMKIYEDDGRTTEGIALLLAATFSDASYSGT